MLCLLSIVNILDFDFQNNKFWMKEYFVCFHSTHRRLVVRENCTSSSWSWNWYIPLLLIFGRSEVHLSYFGPVDFFPPTFHHQTCPLLKKKKNAVAWNYKKKNTKRLPSFPLFTFDIFLNLVQTGGWLPPLPVSFQSQWRTANNLIFTYFPTNYLVLSQHCINPLDFIFVYCFKEI